MDHIKLEEIQDVHERLKLKTEMMYATPTVDCTLQLKHVLPTVRKLNVKLESMQCTGSFKARGVVNQFISLSDKDRHKTLVTMSAGNYGKAFAYVAEKMNCKGVVFMPETAPSDRKLKIESYGAEVFQCPTQDLMSNLRLHQQKHDSLFLHSFDDETLILGHTSAALELVEQLCNPVDIVVVCCGGGGFLAGVALGLKLAGWTNCRIIGVEPENAPTMYEAFKEGKIVNTEVKNTIATGLAPPFAGEKCLEVVRAHVNEIVLVSEDEIKNAMKELYNIGLVAEPSGAGAMAGLLSGKIKDIAGKSVAVFLTGGNVSVGELQDHLTSI